MGEALRERLAKAALDAAAYDGENDMDGWCADPYVCEGPVEWDEATERWRDNGRSIAEAVIAEIAAAGFTIVEAGTLERLRAVASAKSYRDGICDALGIDDKRVDVGTVTQRRDPDGPGSITIEVWEA